MAYIHGETLVALGATVNTIDNLAQDLLEVDAGFSMGAIALISETTGETVGVICFDDDGHALLELN